MTPPSRDARPNRRSDDQRRDLRAVAVLVASTGRLANSPVHGDRHWRSVGMIGARLVAATPGTELYPVLLFAMLHDARRENEFWDDDHGRRAARLLDELVRETRVSLSADVQARLWDGLDRHDEGDTIDDPLIGLCWDADRLCLPRVGIQVDPAYLSTTGGRAGIAWSAPMVENPVSWGRLIGP